MIARILEALPVPIFLSLLLFAFFPTFESSIVVVATTAFVGFKLALSCRQDDRFKKLEDEMKVIKDKIEAIQIGKSFGR